MIVWLYIISNIYIYSMGSDGVPVNYHHFMYDNINTQYINYKYDNINISSLIQWIENEFITQIVH